MALEASLSYSAILLLVLLAGHVTESTSYDLMFYHSCPNHQQGEDLFATPQLAPSARRHHPSDPRHTRVSYLVLHRSDLVM